MWHISVTNVVQRSVQVQRNKSDWCQALLQIWMNRTAAHCLFFFPKCFQRILSIVCGSWLCVIFLSLIFNCRINWQIYCITFVRYSFWELYRKCREVHHILRCDVTKSNTGLFWIYHICDAPSCKLVVVHNLKLWVSADGPIENCIIYKVSTNSIVDAVVTG